MRKELNETSREKGVDPITREIVQHALASAADEMAMALYRTAYSTIVRDCLDYSTSLCNADGEMIAQGVTIPLHLGAVPYAMETLSSKFGDDMAPGDVFIMNDPFDGGMHIPDVFIVKPVFWNERRVAFAVATAHHLDMGGRLPGSSACDNTEIFQEGIRIPWLKLYHKGEPDESIFALLRTNVRVPHMMLGDLRAQLAACHIGERAIYDPIERYGPETLKTCAADLIDYTERLMRAEITSWPDESHTFADHMDSDGVGGPPVRLQVTVTIKGDALTVDFTGTSPQVRGAINNTLSFTASAVVLCIRCMVREDIPNTAGMFKPIEIIAPPGTVAHGVMPAASSMRGITGFRMVDTVFGALSGLLPDRVPAAGEGGNTLVVFGGQREDRTPYVYYELLSGTWGGATGPGWQRRAVQSSQCGEQYSDRGCGVRIPDSDRALRAGARQRRPWEVPGRAGYRTGVEASFGRGSPCNTVGPEGSSALRALRGEARQGIDQQTQPGGR